MPNRLVISKPIAAKQGGFDWSTFEPATYNIQSASLVWSWGSEPGAANINYIGTETPTPVNATVKLEIGGYVFYGTCQSDRLVTSTSSGVVRQMGFLDFRDWLEGDSVFGEFNKPDHVIEGGQRYRRYRHNLPQNFFDNIYTWTTAPYSAAQIISFLAGSPTVQVPWTFGRINTDGTHTAAFHASQAYPVYDFSCRGKTFKSALVELAEAQGLLFTHYPVTGREFNLAFAIKGIDGPDVLIPTNSDDREDGDALSGNPTRVLILGDRNHYQVQNLTLQPSWNSAWEQFFDFNLFVNDIYSRIAHAASDPEHIITYQWALSQALEMTVGEYATYVGNSAFRDARMFAGRSRLSMPVKLYIEQVLFRAFQIPSNTWITNTYGGRLYMNSAEWSDLLARVTHDPVTGVMSWDSTDLPDGQAYAIVQGYQIGKDLFESIRPDRFNLTEWNSAQDIWQAIPCRIDDSGEIDGKLIVFDEPVIRSSALVDLVDSKACFKAVPTISVPPVKVAIGVRGEIFRWWQTEPIAPSDTPDLVAATLMKDHVEVSSGLYGEFVNNGGNTEIRYADGETCRYKAVVTANVLLQGQFKVGDGHFTEPVVTGTPVRKLHGKIDRLSLEFNVSNFSVTVNLTKEIGRRFFMPERDLDRGSKLNQLFPGQKQIRTDAETTRKIAKTLRTSKDAYKLMSNAFKGDFGRINRTEQYVRKPAAGAVQNVGAPFHVRTGETLVQPTSDDTGALAAGVAGVRFVGVTVRNGEPSSTTVPLTVPLAASGPCMARVKGPIAAGDSIYFSYATDYLMSRTEADAKDWNYSVGRSENTIADTSIKLIPIVLGAGSGSGGGCDPDTGLWS